jgi:hypothetical protein
VSALDLAAIDAELDEVRRNVAALPDPWAMQALRAAEQLRAEVVRLNRLLYGKTRSSTEPGSP